LQREISKGWIILPASDNNHAGDKIEGSTEIVDHISNDRSDTLGISGRTLYKDLVALASGCKILVGTGGIRVTFDEISEPRFKLLNVLVGPFDL
jgi:hypothetical protein